MEKRVELEKTYFEREELRRLEIEEQRGGEAPNDEVRAYSKQLAAYFDHLTDRDVRSALKYLARNMGHSRADPYFKNAAIGRIVNAVRGDPQGQARLLSLIGQLKSAEVTQLSDLQQAILALLWFPWR